MARFNNRVERPLERNKIILAKIPSRLKHILAEPDTRAFHEALESSHIVDWELDRAVAGARRKAVLIDDDIRGDGHVQQREVDVVPDREPVRNHGLAPLGGDLDRVAWAVDGDRAPAGMCEGGSCREEREEECEGMHGD